MPHPQIPERPLPMSDTWQPDPKLVKENPLVHALAEDEVVLAQAVLDFRTYCKKKRLERARWGNTFVGWLKRGRPT